MPANILVRMDLLYFRFNYRAYSIIVTMDTFKVRLNDFTRFLICKIRTVANASVRLVVQKSFCHDPRSWKSTRNTLFYNIIIDIEKSKQYIKKKDIKTQYIKNNKKSK